MKQLLLELKHKAKQTKKLLPVRCDFFLNSCWDLHFIVTHLATANESFPHVTKRVIFVAPLSWSLRYHLFTVLKGYIDSFVSPPHFLHLPIDKSVLATKMFEQRLAKNKTSTGARQSYCLVSLPTLFVASTSSISFSISLLGTHIQGKQTLLLMIHSLI